MSAQTDRWRSGSGADVQRVDPTIGAANSGVANDEAAFDLFAHRIVVDANQAVGRFCWGHCCFAPDEVGTLR